MKKYKYILAIFTLAFGFIGTMGITSPFYAFAENENEIIENEIIENPYCPGDGVLSVEEFLDVLANYNSPKIINYNFVPVQTDDGLVYSDVELYWTLLEQSGTVSINVTNHTGCVLPMSLASYRVFDQVLSHQEFYSGTGLVNIPSSDTDTILTINLPSCMAQFDLWYGLYPDALEDINYYPYVRMWGFIYNDGYSFSDASGKFCEYGPENIAPIADAGSDQTITLPTSSTNLDGSASTDSDGTIVSYVWTFVSGPTNIDPDDVVNPNITGLVEGTYVFSLTVTDDDGATGTDTMSVTVNPASGGGDNPECSDGVDNDGDSLVDILDAGCHTDGDVNNSDSYDPNDDSELDLIILGTCGIVQAPFPPTGDMLSATTYDYTGPSANPNPGDFVDHAWFHVHDTPVVWDMGTSTNEVYLVPSIDHGPIPGEAREATLYGSTSMTGPWVLGTETNIHTDGPTNWISDNFTALWTFPSNVRYVYAIAGGIQNDGDAEIDAICLLPGVENSAPIADAGLDQTITLPTSSTNLDGSASIDSDGTIVSYVWTFVSGPTNIDPDDVVNPNITGLVEGTYVFSLTVTDDDGATGTDTVSIMVNPVVSSGGGGGGGSRRTSSGSRPIPQGEVLGEQTSCGIYIDKFLRKGYDNDVESVIKLQKFLNDYIDSGLVVDGIYGPKTEQAVRDFQFKRDENVLIPWGISYTTGIFYLTTQTEVNNIMCPELNLPIPSPLINFSQNPNTPTKTGVVLGAMIGPVYAPNSI